VVIDGPLGEHEPSGDLCVSHSFGDKSENLSLAWGQAARIPPRRRTRSPREPTSSAFAKTACDVCCRGPCVQPLQLLQRTAQRLLFVRVCQRERGLVGAAGLALQLGRLGRIPG
jgi:hypothetical protein